MDEAVRVANFPSDVEAEMAAALLQRAGIPFVTVAGRGFYDRYEHIHFTVSELPMLEVFDEGAAVQVATDLRQRICVQCHAPNGFHQAGSADDRTPRGVHEGLSCSACHATHSNDASGSCSHCHPQLSNCGIPVDTMDTSFRDPESPHNIHFVACGDCHERAFLRRVGRIADG